MQHRAAVMASLLNGRSKYFAQNKEFLGMCLTQLGVVFYNVQYYTWSHFNKALFHAM